MAIADIQEYLKLIPAVNRAPQHSVWITYDAEDSIYMLEPKSRNEMEDSEVPAKKEAAVIWCSRATAHALNNRGKPWKYVLISHDAIAQNMTLVGLVSRFGVN